LIHVGDLFLAELSDRLNDNRGRTEALQPARRSLEVLAPRDQQVEILG